MNDSPIRVKATATSFRILDALLELETARVTELADHVGLSKGGVHNHLVTLESLGYVVRDGPFFRASLQFLDVGTQVRRTHRIYELATDEVTKLAQASGYTAGLVTREQDTAVCIDTATGGDVEKACLELGATDPLHCGAAGKAILAMESDDERTAYVEQSGSKPSTDSRISDERALREELQDIRRNGIAFDRQEYRTNIREIAAAVTGPDGNPLGAICIASSTELGSGKRFEQDFPGLIHSSANRIEKKLYELD